MDSYKSRYFRLGERKILPSFSKGASLQPKRSVCLNYGAGSIYRSLLKALRVEQFYRNGLLCRAPVEKRSILKVNFSRDRFIHLTRSPFIPVLDDAINEYST